MGSGAGHGLLAVLRSLILVLAAVWLWSGPATAEERLANPVGDGPPAVSAGFLDPDYPASWSPPAQHLGIDLPAPVGATVRSPVTGTVVVNNTRGRDPFQRHLVIKSAETGIEYVLGHLDSTLEQGDAVAASDPVGAVVAAGTGPHLHLGMNRLSVLAAIDVGAGWGFGRGPVSAGAEEVARRGWIDPLPFLRAGPPVVEELTPPGLLLREPRVLQALLNDLGFAAGEVDGYPGPATRAAVMRFQAAHCLTPTGQLDDATLRQLSTSLREVPDCPGATLSRGIGADAPLLSGIYVTHPAMCDAPPTDLSAAHDYMRIIRGRSFTFGYHTHCEIRRTDITGQLTRFRGTCRESLDQGEGDWTLDLVSQEEFVEVRDIFNRQDGRRFLRCPDQSRFRRDWGAWFGDP